MNKIKKLGFQLGAITLLGFIIIGGYFIFNQYLSTKERLETDNLNRLKAIATTLSFQINAETHQSIIKKYSSKDAITTTYQDSNYASLHTILKQVKEANHIKTDIYTLFYDEHDKQNPVKFGVSSSSKPYFRHTYDHYPEELIKHYKDGSLINLYEDEHGTWLSAFAPITTKSGSVVGVVQVDQQFDEFLMIVKKESTTTFFISLIVTIIITSIVYYFITLLVKQDQQKTQELEIAYHQVKLQKTRIQDSINYAQLIQKAIVPNFQHLTAHNIQSAIIYKPKDVVSGDLPWSIEHEDKIYISAIDCTGHGVPGAMMSFVGYFLLNHITSNKDLLPSEILNLLDQKVRATLKQDRSNGTNDGMDMALIVLDKTNNSLTFAGAKRPLYHQSNDKIQIHKGTSKSIGGQQIQKLVNRRFSDVTINYKEGDRFFIFTDGLPDQFDSTDNKKFSAKRIRAVLEQNYNSSISDSVQQLNDELSLWQKKSPQTDDILFMGIEV